MKCISIFLLLVLISCSKHEVGPEAALREFVDGRAGQIIDRDFVIERVTGKMLENFKSMSDNDFEKFADMKNIRTDSFKVLSKSCQEKKCFVTYSVAYVTKNNDKPSITL